MLENLDESWWLAVGAALALTGSAAGGAIAHRLTCRSARHRIASPPPTAPTPRQADSLDDTVPRPIVAVADVADVATDVEELVKRWRHVYDGTTTSARHAPDCPCRNQHESRDQRRVDRSRSEADVEVEVEVEVEAVKTTEPRVWNVGDARPHDEDLTVRDRDGDVWERRDGGWRLSSESDGEIPPAPWSYVVSFAPLVEVIDDQEIREDGGDQP